MINNLPRLNPEQYAQKYAQDNNVSLEQARAQLESQYGAPQAPQGPQGMQGAQGPQMFQGAQAPQMPQQFQGGGNAYAGMDIFDKMELLNQHFSQEEIGSEQFQEQNPFINFLHQLFGFFSRNDSSQQENSNNSNKKEEQTIETPKKDTTTSKKEKQDPDTVAKEYMEQYNKDNPDDTITLKEAKELLKEQYGAPEQK